jgi:hypothetical protein
VRLIIKDTPKEQGMVSGNQQPTADQDQAELAELRGSPAMNGRTPKPPPQIMRSLDREPVEGPHQANDAALWISPERREAIRRAEAADAAELAGPRHLSGSGRVGDPFVLSDSTVEPASDWAERRRARQARMWATVAGARFPGDRPEDDR